MGAAVSITLMTHSATQLRGLAARSGDTARARRLLALAMILEGASRLDAARCTGMDRQTLRDWVHRYNEEGVDGLASRKAPGAAGKLRKAQMADLRDLVIAGPDPEVDKVIRWRCVDLCAQVEKRYSVVVSERTMGKWLNKLGLARLQPRPHHPKKDAAAQEAFKTYGPPRLQELFSRQPMISLLQRIRLRRHAAQPRWRYARSRPHKSLGVERRFLNQASRTPFDCQAISLSPLANIIDRSTRSGVDRPIAKQKMPG